MASLNIPSSNPNESQTENSVYCPRYLKTTWILYVYIATVLPVHSLCFGRSSLSNLCKSLTARSIAIAYPSDRMVTVVTIIYYMCVIA